MHAKSEKIPRPEYPRPQMVRKEWLNLNGAWEFEFDPGNSGLERGFAAGAPLSRKIIVPFCPESALSGIGEKDFVAAVWYRRKFTLPTAWKQRRVMLHFGAVDYEATVWVNGQKAGWHRGGYSSFSIEITSFAKPGENEIVVRAVDDTRSLLQATGKQSMKFNSHGCVYTRTTGIWQTVWLEAVPQTFIADVRFFSGEGSVNLCARVEGRTKGLALAATVLADGKKVGHAEVPAAGVVTCSVALGEHIPWFPGKPFLYDVKLELKDGEKAVDRVDGYFGLRDIRIEGRKFLINGEMLFQRLVLDQGFYPEGVYTAPTDGALKRDIEISLAMGFNGARLHQKIFEPRFLYWADKLGYMVWGEYPSWGLDIMNPYALERMLPEWIETVERDFNHPSIVGWCPFNETNMWHNPELLRTVYRMTKKFDPTRPVIDTSGHGHVETDVYDVHNYSQEPKVFAELFEEFKTTEKAWQHFPRKELPYSGQPYFVSEYGGIWWNPKETNPNAWGYGTRPKSEEEFLTRYRALTETLLFHPKMIGFCYTQLYDVEQEVNGLYTYDRKAKFEPKVIREINAQKAAME